MPIDTESGEKPGQGTKGTLQAAESLSSADAREAIHGLLDGQQPREQGLTMRRLRDMTTLQQKEIADLLSWNQATVSRFELGHGKKSLSSDEVGKVANLLSKSGAHPDGLPLKSTNAPPKSATEVAQQGRDIITCEVKEFRQINNLASVRASLLASIPYLEAGNDVDALLEAIDLWEDIEKHFEKELGSESGGTDVYQALKQAVLGLVQKSPNILPDSIASFERAPNLIARYKMLTLHDLTQRTDALVPVAERAMDRARANVDFAKDRTIVGHSHNQALIENVMFIHDYLDDGISARKAIDTFIADVLAGTLWTNGRNKALELIIFHCKQRDYKEGILAIAQGMLAPYRGDFTILTSAEVSQTNNYTLDVVRLALRELQSHEELNGLAAAAQKTDNLPLAIKLYTEAENMRGVEGIGDRYLVLGRVKEAMDTYEYAGAIGKMESYAAVLLRQGDKDAASAILGRAGIIKLNSAEPTKNA